MGYTEQNDVTDERFQGLLGSYLRLRSSSGLTGISHLDQDTLSAFAEGNITRREATPVVSHLADCSFCRHITSELVCLDLAFAVSENSGLLVSDQAPAKMSEVLGTLLSRIFGTNDATVFAHNEPDDAEKIDEDQEKSDEKE